MTFEAVAETVAVITLAAMFAASVWVFLKYPPLNSRNWTADRRSDDDLRREKLRAEWEQIQEDRA